MLPTVWCAREEQLGLPPPDSGCHEGSVCFSIFYSQEVAKTVQGIPFTQPPLMMVYDGCTLYKIRKSSLFHYETTGLIHLSSFKLIF